MFPSNSNQNINDPIACIDHSILHRHFGNDMIITSDLPPLSIFHFPSPYYDNHFDLLGLEDSSTDDHVFLPQHHHNDLSLIHHHQTSLTTTTPDNSASASASASGTITDMPDSSKNEQLDYCTKTTKKTSCHNATSDHQQILMRKRPSKRDRHSKINTAKGPRDRRMRLSLEVAREFFGLQDMLGYDKASKTVEWLLIQARPEIKKLCRTQVSLQMNLHSCTHLAAAKTPISSTSEGEVVSSSGIDDKAAMEGISIAKAKPSTTKERKARQPRKTTFRPLARDLREKARARAKARTKAKIMWTTQSQLLDDESKLCDHDGPNNNELNNFSSRSSFETVEESGSTQDHNWTDPSFKELSSHDSDHIRIHGGIGDESLSIMNNSIFSCLQNAGINQELTSFLPFGKPWEG